jgi:DNA polymerase III alpha subunit
MIQSSISNFFKPVQKKEEAVSKSPLPGFTGKTAKECLEPLFIRPIPDSLRYINQLQEEYKLIDMNNFTQVFLQVRTILELIDELSKESGHPIPHIIRGSAGSSLVCYLLGITQIDPLLHGIQLARFMNSERKDIPDIDIDVPYNRREEIYGRIAKTWPGMVARISNYCMWSSKTALRESVKDILREKGEEIPRTINRKYYKLENILENQNEIALARKKAEEKKGTLKNYSKHCGGIVIFEQNGEVPQELILQKIEANKTPLVQIHLNKDDTEKEGFIKIDLLSNRGLAQLAEICPDRPLTWYPLRDGATERIFEKGLNIGITFGESRGMRKLFMEMKPRNVNDLAVALALIRPAAAAEGRKQEFLEKWKIGKTGDPLCQPIIYDDDAIKKIRMGLSCSGGEADVWRKAFAKGNARARIDFRLRMYEAGHTQDTVDKVVDDLNQLIYYSFCKSHAISYAQLVWALAYWKAHRVHEFWVAAINHCHSEYRKWVHYREARCSGLFLSRSPGPYRLGKRDGNPALISVKGEQGVLAELSPSKELSDFGYWTGEGFLPSCGLWMDKQIRLDGKKTYKFRGIIASARTVTREWGDCTLICLGVANREYIDLSIPNAKRNDLFRWMVLEGSGIMKKEGSIEVIKIHGVSISKCFT